MASPDLALHPVSLVRPSRAQTCRRDVHRLYQNRWSLHLPLRNIA